jgi:hypothetical protein
MPSHSGHGGRSGRPSTNHLRRSLIGRIWKILSPAFITIFVRDCLERGSTGVSVHPFPPVPVVDTHRMMITFMRRQHGMRGNPAWNLENHSCSGAPGQSGLEMRCVFPCVALWAGFWPPCDFTLRVAVENKKNKKQKTKNKQW